MKQLFLLGTVLLLSSATFAKDPGDSTENLAAAIRQMDSLESTLHYKTGKITLDAGTISINVPPNFKFLDAADAKKVVEDLWGNPPSSDPMLGLLMPASGTSWNGSYAYIVSYDKMGYVKDDDASDINYTDLLKDLREGNVEENKERTRLGIPNLNLVGWAAKPYYDKEKKVLHWAKEYIVPGDEEHTLNYDVRVLGRKGILILQAVATMDQLDSVNAHVNDVLAMATFTEGNRYSDFDSGSDNVAAWTIGGLVAGKVLTKLGFFALILKFGKFILLGLTVAGGAIWRFITGRKKKKPEDEYVYQPSNVPTTNQTNIPDA